jgi:hypothetical protein
MGLSERPSGDSWTRLLRGSAANAQPAGGSRLEDSGRRLPRGVVSWYAAIPSSSSASTPAAAHARRSRLLRGATGS